MQPVSTAWWKNGKTEKSSSRSQKKNGFSWIRKSGETKTNHRTEWCVEANKYRRLRCGRSSKFFEDARDVHRADVFCPDIWENGEGDTWGPWFGKQSGQAK